MRTVWCALSFLFCIPLYSMEPQAQSSEKSRTLSCGFDFRKLLRKKIEKFNSARLSTSCPELPTFTPIERDAVDSNGVVIEEDEENVPTNQPDEKVTSAQ